jgi:hypothetical protein
VKTRRIAPQNRRETLGPNLGFRGELIVEAVWFEETIERGNR